MSLFGLFFFHNIKLGISLTPARERFVLLAGFPLFRPPRENGRYCCCCYWYCRCLSLLWFAVVVMINIWARGAGLSGVASCFIYIYIVLLLVFFWRSPFFAFVLLSDDGLLAIWRWSGGDLMTIRWCSGDALVKHFQAHRSSSSHHQTITRASDHH